MTVPTRTAYLTQCYKTGRQPSVVSAMRYSSSSTHQRVSPVCVYHSIAEAAAGGNMCSPNSKLQSIIAATTWYILLLRSFSKSRLDIP